MKRFTLIELLAVVVVILVLASMLMPALLQSRKLAKQAVCFSNLKQIYTLELMFAGNNRSRVTPTSPEFGWVSPMETIWLSWDDFLGIGYDGRNLVVSDVNWQKPDYPTPTKTSWIYNCPLDKRSTGDLVARSYAINVEIAQCKYERPYLGTNLTKIPNAGQSILFAERIVDSRTVINNGDVRGSVIGNDEVAGFSNGNRPGNTLAVTMADLSANQWISNHPRNNYLPWLFADGHLELQGRVNDQFSDFSVH